MEKSLFGTATREKILFYLLQNKKCYSSELVHIFGMLYTRVRGGLVRLRELGILQEYNDGKNHFYYFDPKYPFLKELKALLRQMYKKLPQIEKEKYYENKRRGADD